LAGGFVGDLQQAFLGVLPCFLAGLLVEDGQSGGCGHGGFTSYGVVVWVLRVTMMTV
jgi:hypothetical protein